MVALIKHAVGKLSSGQRARGRSARWGLRLLDVGGNAGDAREMQLRRLTNYSSLDFEPVTSLTEGTARRSIVGNIQKCNLPTLLSGAFHVVTAFNIFEHLADAHLAAQEMLRVVAPGGLMVTLTPWIWRYHPFPMDFARYTHTGMRYLFERHGRVRTLYTSYAEAWGRTTVGRYPDKSDQPASSAHSPEQILLLWVGVRDDNASFNPNSFDVSIKFRGANITSYAP